MTTHKQVTLDGYPVELNDRLWDPNMGWCTVIELNHGDQFSIRLKMDKGGEMVVDPKQLMGLFWQPIDIDPPPKPEPEIDWSKVPSGVEVRSNTVMHNNLRFVAYCDPDVTDMPPHWVVCLPVYIWLVDDCRLAPGVEVKKEWLK